jgi:hypothetical protein
LRACNYKQELIAAEATLQQEIAIAELASMLQLAVMWSNHWSDEFEAGYLATISGDETVVQDTFTDVDWIAVARAYGAKYALFGPFGIKSDHFTKQGSGQNIGKIETLVTKGVFLQMYGEVLSSTIHTTSISPMRSRRPSWARWTR